MLVSPQAGRISPEDLLGREFGRRQTDRVLVAAGHGLSAGLVLQGEPGIGKDSGSQLRHRAGAFTSSSGFDPESFAEDKQRRCCFATDHQLGRWPRGRPGLAALLDEAGPFGTTDAGPPSMRVLQGSGRCSRPGRSGTRCWRGRVPELAGVRGVLVLVAAVDPVRPLRWSVE